MADERVSGAITGKSESHRAMASVISRILTLESTTEGGVVKEVVVDSTSTLGTDKKPGAQRKRKRLKQKVRIIY